MNQIYKQNAIMHENFDTPKRLQHEYDIYDANTESQNEPNLQTEPLSSKIPGSLELCNFLRNIAKQGQVNQAT